MTLGRACSSASNLGPEEALRGTPEGERAGRLHTTLQTGLWGCPGARPAPRKPSVQPATARVPGLDHAQPSQPSRLLRVQ